MDGYSYWLQTAFCIAIVLFVDLAYVFCASAVERAASIKWMRDHPVDVVVIFVFVVCATLYGGSKGNTNQPPTVVDGPAKTIRLYYTDSNGRLIPLGAQIKGENQ